jgi:hypothetical protein
VTSPDWLPEDRGALLGLAAHEKSLCPGCGEPKELAWHDDLEDEWDDPIKIVCHSCTSRDGHQAVFAIPRLWEGAPLDDLRPFDLETTTTTPDARRTGNGSGPNQSAMEVESTL